MPLSAAEQYMLELINRARLDPFAEAERYGIDPNDGLDEGRIGPDALQVLAQNEALSVAAREQSTWLLDTDTFTHSGENGSFADDRMRDAGYVFSGEWAWAENLAWTGTTGAIDLEEAIVRHYDDLYLSPGHRANTFSANMKEVGLAQVEGTYILDGTAYNSSMLTENFAMSGESVFITGVAYQDSDRDNFYSIGEGQEGVVFTAENAQGTTAQAGGYALEIVQQDAAIVAIDIGDQRIATVQMDISRGNGKLDVVTQTNGAMSLNLSVDGRLISGVGDATLLGVGDLDLRGNDSANRLTGNAGDNYLSGQRGRDVLRGNDGEDVMDGGRGKDRLFGGNDDDRLIGGSSRDKLYGQSGDDILNGNNGRDVLKGGRGNDVLDGGRGNDKLVGGSGADTFIFNKGDDRITDFDDTLDQIEISAQLLGSSDLADLMVIQGDNVVINFDDGSSLTIDDYNDTALLLESIIIA